MITNLIISLLTGILIGYSLGYCLGKKRGIKTARQQAPVDLLIKSLEKGYCIVCNQKTEKIGRNSRRNVE